MSNNIIDFKNIRDHIFFNNLNKKEIGNINITVYSTDICNSPIYYILPDKKELLPIVDLIDDTLTNNSFKFSEGENIENLK